MTARGWMALATIVLATASMAVNYLTWRRVKRNRR